MSICPKFLGFKVYEIELSVEMCGQECYKVDGLLRVVV